MSGCWGLSARRDGEYLHVRLVLRGPLGVTLEWVEVPPVAFGEPQEAALAASVVARASRRAISKRAALRVIRGAP